MYQTKIIDGKVRKYFLSPWSAKWVVGLPFLVFYPYTMNPKTRFFRELNFFREWYNLNHNFVKVPKIISVDYSNLIIEREYIEGSTIIDLGIEHLKMIFKALAHVHQEGWVLGDTKPSNFLISEGYVYIIDAEQAIKSKNVKFMAWDTAILLLFSTALSIFEKEYLGVIPEDMLVEYLEINPNNAVIRLALNYFNTLKAFRTQITKIMP